MGCAHPGSCPHVGRHTGSSPWGEPGAVQRGWGDHRHWVVPAIKAIESEQWRVDRAEARGWP